VYGEMRVSATIEGREIEMALFVRATDDEDCHGRAISAPRRVSPVSAMGAWWCTA